MTDWGETMLQKAAFFTLGCKVNQTETEAAEGMFEDAGFEMVDFSEIADVYVINTCTVTSSADRKSRQMIRRARQHGQTRNNTVIVMGCYAQSSSDEILEKLDVDLVIGNTHRALLVDYLRQYQQDGIKKVYVDDIMKEKEFEKIKSKRRIRRTRAFLKIQEGCQQFCSYCIIPYTRGPIRSMLPDEVCHEVAELENQGFKEVVLTGIHIGSYGLDHKKGYLLPDLIRDILKKTESIRVRISSIEPTEVTEALLSLIAKEERICDHLHIPLQSGDDMILKKMNRPYDTDFYRKVMTMARSYMPDIAITTDIMVGFPFEEESHARHTLAFAKEMNFSDVHVFAYSPRDNTPASTYKHQVPKQEKEKRSAELIELARQMKHSYMELFINHPVQVLFEQEHAEKAEGHTSKYLKVMVYEPVAKNEYRTVLPEKIENEMLIGKIL